MIFLCKGLSSVTIRAFLVLLMLVAASACRPQEPLSLSYRAVTRPSMPVAYFAGANGHYPTPTSMVVVGGINTDPSPGGGGSVGFTVKALAAENSEIEYSIYWLELGSDKGWHAEFSVNEADFPEYDGSQDQTEFGGKLTQVFGERPERAYSTIFLFEENGALVILTSGADLLNGRLNDLAKWSDYVILAKVCAKAVADIKEKPPFKEVKDLSDANVTDIPSERFDEGNILPPDCSR